MQTVPNAQCQIEVFLNPFFLLPTIFTMFCILIKFSSNDDSEVAEASQMAESVVLSLFAILILSF